MRLAARLGVLAIALCLLILACFRQSIQSRLDQQRVGDYIRERIRQQFKDGLRPGILASVRNGGSMEMTSASPQGHRKGDKVIVMAKLEAEDTRWVEEELPDWQSAIYTVNPSKKPTDTNRHKHPHAAAAMVDSIDMATNFTLPQPYDTRLPRPLEGANDDESITATDTVTSDTLTTPRNKGRESMAYLTYIIDNYASPTLPAVIIFLHSHRSGFSTAWHVDSPLHSNVDTTRMLNLSHVQAEGYVNLRCNHNPGCLPAHTHNAHVTPEIYNEVFQGTSFFPSYAPERVGAACCAQFAVSREQVRSRPHSDYVRLRDWVLSTELDDGRSGRVMEFLWHIVFGRESVHCPPEKECYCKVYGRCG